MNEESVTSTPMPTKPSIVAVHMVKKYAALFPGERAGFEKDIASMLIENGIAVPINSNGLPIFSEEQKSSPALIDENTSALEAGQEITEPIFATEEIRPQSTIDAFKPFLADGVDRDVAKALIGAGLDTPDRVSAAITEGCDLTKIRGIGPKSFSSLKTLYGE